MIHRELIAASGELIQTSFDYDACGITGGERAALEKRASEARGIIDRYHKLQGESVIRLGAVLADAQERLSNNKNGTFCKWVQATVGITPQTARNIMAASLEFSNCKTVLQYFDPTAMYRLAAKRCPEEAREEAVERAESGERITSKLAVEIIDRHKERKRREKSPFIAGEAQDAQHHAITDLADLAGRQFGCIYADPPWQYGNQATRASTDNHYSTMTVEQLCEMPIASIAAADSHLHLWTTNGFLFDSKRVMDAWGFEYKSCFIWVKPQIGIGNYWRVSHEFLLLGVRGDAKRFNERTHRSWMEFNRTEHSEKPDAVRGIIERVSPGPFLELFGRKPISGWTVFGNQIEARLFAS